MAKLNRNSTLITFGMGSKKVKLNET